MNVRTLNEIISCNFILFVGIGNASASCISFIERNSNAELFLFDSDERKAGKNFNGRVIRNTNEISNYLTGEYAVVISCIKWQKEIAEELCKTYHIAEDHLFGYTNEFFEKAVYQTSEIEADKISEVMDLLEDDQSKNYVLSSIKYRFSRNPMDMCPNPQSKKMGIYGEVVCVERGNGIVDCGAYTGDTAAMYSSYVNNDCVIYAFEPYLESYKILKQNMKAISCQSYCYNYAVSDEERNDTIYYNDSMPAVQININNEDGEHSHAIQVKRLDDVLKKIENIDFIKMDIEGEEVKALYGAKNILKVHRPKLMISAYHDFWHIFEIPKTIKQLNSDYKIYAGHAPHAPIEIEFYAKVK